MGKTKLNSQAVGLDIGLAFTKWLTGAENLHYGIWTDLDVCASNLRQAQEVYTERLFQQLPKGPLNILDIGGGAGETARKLTEMGHQVQIVVPSPFLAERCRQNAPSAQVHLTKFEDFETTTRFDLCLFSESFQYIPLQIGLSKAHRLLRPGGHVLLADCFRSDSYRWDPIQRTVGGGHPVRKFRQTLADLPFAIDYEEDITDAVAPSVEVEQALFNVIGYGLTRVDEEMARGRPLWRWMYQRLLRAFLCERRRARLDQRLNQNTRNAQVFAHANRYLLMRLSRQAEAH